MDLSAVYAKTGKGAMALAGKIKALPSSSLRVLTHVDGKTSAEAIMAEFGKLAKPKFNQILSQLLEEGYIRVVTNDYVEDIFSNSDISSSPMIVKEITAQEFLQIGAEQENSVSAPEDQQQKEPEHKAHGTNETSVSSEAAEKLRTSVDRTTREQIEAAARTKAYAEKQLRLEAAALAQKETERKMLEVADLLSRSADSTNTEIKASETGAQVGAEIEAGRKASEEAKARVMREAEEGARQAAEAQAKALAETKQKAQEERTARLKHLAEEKTRIAAERKTREQANTAARAKAYAEEQLRLESAALAQKEAERKMLETADLLSKSADVADIAMTAKKEVARIEAEAHLEAERKARAMRAAEQEARIEAVRKAREAAKTKTKAEAEAQAIREAKAREELERKEREEVKARVIREAEEEARIEAEREATEARARAEAEAQVKREAKARAEAERKAREEFEALAKREAQETARIEAELKAREVAELKARAKAEAQAKREAEETARAEAKRKTREEAEIRAKLKAQEKARIAAERKIREVAAVEIKAAAKQQAKLDAEARTLAKAENKALARTERSPVNINKWLINASAIGRNTLISIFIIALVLLALLRVVNITALLNPIEKLAEENIHEPVAIKEVHASLWPQPHLVLDDVTIGGLSDVKVASIRIFPELSTVFGETKTLKSIEIETLILVQNSLERPVKWISSASKQGKLKFDRIFLKGSSIKIPNLELSPINGDIKLSPSGELRNATLVTDDHKLMIKITPNNQTYEIDLVANAWQPPLGFPVIFDQLSAKAEADSNQISFSQIEGTLYGGTIKAQMTVNWANAWNVSGNFELSRVNLQEIIPKFSSDITLKGKLNANANFSLQAVDFAKLVDAPVINASFVAHNGSINGIDLVRAMQTNGKANALSGSTRFDKFSGKMLLKDGHYQYRQLTLKEGQFLANGEADIFENRLSGNINIELTTKSRQLRSRLGLSGQLRSPMVK